MDKVHLVKHLMASNPKLKMKEVDLAVKVILDAMSDSLAKGGRIEIRGFGSFSLSACRPQQDFSRLFGGMVVQPANYVPQFKPAKELRERVEAMAETRTVIEAAIHGQFRIPHGQPAGATVYGPGNVPPVPVPTGCAQTGR